MAGGWKNGGTPRWMEAPRPDGEVWLSRQAINADRALVRSTCSEAFITGDRVYVRTRELAKKLDKGLVLR